MVDESRLEELFYVTAQETFQALNQAVPETYTVETGPDGQPLVRAVGNAKPTLPESTVRAFAKACAKVVMKAREAWVT